MEVDESLARRRAASICIKDAVRSKPRTNNGVDACIRGTRAFGGGGGRIQTPHNSDSLQLAKRPRTITDCAYTLVIVCRLAISVIRHAQTLRCVVKWVQRVEAQDTALEHVIRGVADKRRVSMSRDDGEDEDEERKGRDGDGTSELGRRRER